MKEFNSSGELIIQDETITEPGSPVNKKYVDSAVYDATFSPRVLLHYGTGNPVLSSFPDARVGDIIERISDGSRWRVGENQTLVRTVENFYNLNIAHRLLNRNGETAGNVYLSRQGRMVTLRLDFAIPEGGPKPGTEVLHLPSVIWSGSSLYWPPGYANDTMNVYVASGYLHYPGTARMWVRRTQTWMTSADGAAVTEAELLSPPTTP